MTAVVLMVTLKSWGWVRRGSLLWQALPQDTGSTAEEELGHLQAPREQGDMPGWEGGGQQDGRSEVRELAARLSD